MAATRKSRKIWAVVIVALVLCAIVGIGLFLRWEMPLKDQLPEEIWQDVGLYGIYLENQAKYTVDKDAAERIVAAISTAQVSLGLIFEEQKDGVLQIILYPQDVNEAVVLTLTENGKIYISNHFTSLFEAYFADDGTLYRHVYAIANKLPTEIIAVE